MRSKTQFTGLALTTTLLSLAMPVNANEILFTFVDDSLYVSHGQELASYINTLSDFNVTQRVLSDEIYHDYDKFDQIWVYDLELGTNNSTTQMANYAGIANWFNNRQEQNLIADGRILSSAMAHTNQMSSETPWIQNYAIQLANLGGGLVLGTDHAASGQSSGVFVDGINEINAMIGITPFSGNFGGSTSQASVDANSPLAIDSLDDCRSGDGLCINDSTSTSFAPAGEQPGGLFLTPVAYHGTTSTAFSSAAVSSTISSSTFTPVPEPSTVLGSMAVTVMGFFFKNKKRQSA